VTTQEHQARINDLVASRQALRAGKAPRDVLEQNRLALASAIRAFNRTLVAAHLVGAN
jgi:hypothetical protein